MWDGAVVCVTQCLDSVFLCLMLAVTVGRVNCLGTRLAKVEMKAITALLLLGFEFTTVGADGTLCNPHPRPNWNDVLTCRPDNADFTLRYARRQAPL